MEVKCDVARAKLGRDSISVFPDSRLFATITYIGARTFRTPVAFFGLMKSSTFVRVPAKMLFRSQDETATVQR